ncbi:MAG: dipeptide epimerase [Euryarchaeota archaeon]|nr:dipeptide epimerase [Euryarchaeota archaeon]
MELTWSRLHIPYRSGRFVISGDTTATNDTFVVQATMDGKVGLGEAVPSRRVVGVGADEVEAELGRAKSALGPRSRSGDAAPPLPLPDLPSPVRCALDGALLDLWSTRREEPLWRALGLPRPEIPTTATVSLGRPEEMAREAQGHRAAGFRTLKVKLGEGQAEADIARIRAVHEVAGGVPLRVDANEGWNLTTTERLLPVLAECDVEVLEQPLPRDARPGDLRALTLAAEDEGVAHLLDEAAHGAPDVKRIGEDRLAHGVVLKLQKAGGLRAGLDVVDEADRQGLKVMVGCFVETWAGIALALQLAGRVAWADLDGAWLLAEEPVVPVEPFLEDGVLKASERPGLGIRAAPEVLSR